MDTLLEKNLLDESLEDIYSKYYIGKLDKDEFDDVIALDPTFSSEQDKLGSYGKWLLTLAIKNGTESLLQESEEVTDQLGIFDEHKRSYDVNDRDIMRCKSLQDLIEVNHKYEAEEASNEMIKANNVEGLRILGNTSNWEIYNPQTYEAAKYIRGDNAV